MTIIPVGFAQVNLQFESIILPYGAEVTYGIADDSDPDPVSGVAAVHAGFWATHLAENTNAAVRLESVKVKRGPNDTGAEATVGIGSLGTEEAQCTPPNICAVVRKISASGGRKNRGRLFWPSLDEEQVTGDGRLEPGYRTTLQASFAAWLEDMADNFNQMHILHNDATPPTPVTALSVNTIVGLQKRRLQGG